ncbi:NAD(P)-dependent oxidoreductase [Haloarcula nitratireducens]|uniref:NAD-binding protein n=1 Tax=Haloarcula nitratireducens TaxID=2487749 RepID=A0AAW4PJR5_9EURY|nr:NAD(P)-binding domain-containing protein [Halomicroarcula nitratireducens]MBX0297701.1 NAD-binding protein [Halomicroarcula nitratireducens]
MTSKSIGFIGTGIMGKPMAENVLDAGYSVIAYNRSQEPVKQLVDKGARAATSPAEVTRNSDVVVTVLPDTDAVTSVVRGDDGVLQALNDGQIYIDMSTISPAATERLSDDVEQEGAEMLDAPISGGEEGAIDGTLSIMVGGREDTFNAVCDLLEAMGDTITRCGDSGAGQVTKAANQIIVGCQHQAVAEALLLAKQGGADLERVLEAISGGAAACWSLDARAPRVIRGNFAPGFFSSYHYKDLRIAMDAGEEYGTPMPATGIVHEMYKSMEQKGYGQDDHSGVIQIIEDLAGEKARIDE